ncbi:hypothetical protein BCR34DRAFT_377847 [Clohesyomyces aquaticus]|uniref:Uncharacterized protein n=1 Tax=Clohesyomyces aquaticus TaxID=1231657 RepID=A0A1Y2A629_9PLEO|nr:hypothetical protein BCR34DRAFT_377847 [Clohesyomyces aquaticus]
MCGWYFRPSIYHTPLALSRQRLLQQGQAQPMHAVRQRHKRTQSIRAIWFPTLEIASFTHLTNTMSKPPNSHAFLYSTGVDLTFSICSLNSTLKSKREFSTSPLQHPEPISWKSSTTKINCTPNNPRAFDTSPQYPLSSTPATPPAPPSSHPKVEKLFP